MRQYDEMKLLLMDGKIGFYFEKKAFDQNCMSSSFISSLLLLLKLEITCALRTQCITLDDEDNKLHTRFVERNKKIVSHGGESLSYFLFFRRGCFAAGLG